MPSIHCIACSENVDNDSLFCAHCQVITHSGAEKLGVQLNKLIIRWNKASVYSVTSEEETISKDLLNGGGQTLLLLYHPVLTNDPSFVQIEREEQIIAQMHLSGIPKFLSSGRLGSHAFRLFKGHRSAVACGQKNHPAVESFQAKLKRLHKALLDQKIQRCIDDSTQFFIIYDKLLNPKDIIWIPLPNVGFMIKSKNPESSALSQPNMDEIRGTDIEIGVISITLRLHKEDGGIKDLQFHQNDIYIGRARSNDFVIDKEKISKRHVRIFFKDYKWLLCDLSSTNGTWLNQAPASKQEQELSAGDLITLGDQTLEIFTCSPIQFKKANEELKTKVRIDAIDLKQMPAHQSNHFNPLTTISGSYNPVLSKELAFQDLSSDIDPLTRTEITPASLNPYKEASTEQVPKVAQNQKSKQETQAALKRLFQSPTAHASVDSTQQIKSVFIDEDEDEDEDEVEVEGMKLQLENPYEYQHTSATPSQIQAVDIPPHAYLPVTAEHSNAVANLHNSNPFQPISHVPISSSELLQHASSNEAYATVEEPSNDLLFAPMNNEASIPSHSSEQFVVEKLQEQDSDLQKCSYSCKGKVALHHQMTTQQLFPFYVELTIERQNLQPAQESSSESFLLLQPILPGCLVSPSSRKLPIDRAKLKNKTRSTFWITPATAQDLQRIAQLEIWDEQQCIQILPLPVKVKSANAAKGSWALSLLLFFSWLALLLLAPTSEAGTLLYQTLKIAAISFSVLSLIMGIVLWVQQKPLQSEVFIDQFMFMQK